MPADADEQLGAISGKPVEEVTLPGGVRARVYPDGVYQVEQIYMQDLVPQAEKDAHLPWDARPLRRSNVIGVTPDGRQIFCFCGGTSF